MIIVGCRLVYVKKLQIRYVFCKNSVLLSVTCPTLHIPVGGVCIASFEPVLRAPLKIIKGRFLQVHPMPFYIEDNMSNDIYLLKKYFQVVPEKYDISLYSSIRYLIGMRYHSLVFATQCGIPFISLSYQSKCEEFCSELGLNNLSQDLYMNIDELGKKIDYLKNHYSGIRNCLIEYREANARKISRIFKSITHSIY